jgi:hypothetical protein
VYLVRAGDAEEAEMKGRGSALRDDSLYLNDEGKPATVTLVRVDHVHDLLMNRLRSGAEVFSLLYETDDDGGIDIDVPAGRSA